MQTATNPQTGEKVQWNGSAWVPLGEQAPSAPQAGVPELVVPPQPKAQEPPSGYRFTQGGGLEAIPGGPADKTHGAPDFKPTEFQSKSAGFLGRLVRANSAWEALPEEGRAPRGIIREYVHENFPAQENKYLNTGGRQVADETALDFIRASLRQESGASINADEETKQYKIYFPMPGDGPEVLAEKALARRQAIAGFKVAAGALADGALASVEAPGGHADQSTNLGDVSAPPGETLTRSTNGFETTDNPKMAGVRGEYLSRLQAGQGAGEIIPWLRSVGIADPGLYRSALQQIKFRKAHPNAPIENYDTNALDDMDVPLSKTETLMNEAGQTAPGAYAMRAGQALSMNTLDNLAPNPERARIGLEDAGNQHPTAALLGDISGTVIGSLGAEGALAARGAGAGIGRELVANTAVGAASGAGAADDGNRLGGAVWGGVEGLGGTVAGHGLAKGVGAAVSPTGGKLAGLYESGVRPTPGQRLVNANEGKGLSGLVGRAANATEEGLSSVPIVGAAIRGARQEARDQFQIGAYNKALEDIGAKLPKGMKPGTAPYSFTKSAFDKAYDDARSGMSVAADGELASHVADLSDGIQTLAEPSIKRFQAIVKNTVMRRITSDVIDGTTYKAIQSDLGNAIRGIRKSPTGDGELADKLEDLKGILDQAARRHSDPAAVAKLDAADAGYAKFVRIRDAAKARGGGAGEFSPAQFDRSVQKNTGGRHSDAYLRGDALMQDYADQGMSLVDRVPNSGTPERIAVGGTVAGGAAYLEPSTLGLLGTIGLLYAPGVRKGVAGAMAPRGAHAKAIADAVRKRGRIAGAAGAGLALSGQKDGDQ